ncbi:MAG: PaaI family thioesterase [Candidatus Acidiferrales bacterium]
MTIEKLEPKPDNPCFGCGADNPRGMMLTFEQDHEARKIVGRFRLGPEYQGSNRVLHGGIIAVLLDEAMGKLNRFHSVRAVTAELNVEYLRPVPIDEEIVVEAQEVSREGRNLMHRGEIRNAAGKVLARGRGRFVVVGQPAQKSEDR